MPCHYLSKNIIIYGINNIIHSILEKKSSSSVAVYYYYVCKK